MDRALDVLIACILIIFTMPLMAVVALAIKLDSPGPVLCRVEGVWFDGRRRTDLLKFRTTLHGSDCVTHGAPWTCVGRYLYLSRIDELPRLFNIFRGDLSLFGAPARALLANRVRRRG